MTSENTSDSAPSSQESSSSVDYTEVIRFLVDPFLESSDSLRINCETNPRNGRVLIRLAIEGEDKGKVFGRGGRNIQAVRTTLQAVSQAVNQKVHIEVYGSESGRSKSDRPSGGGGGRRSSHGPPRRAPRPRPNPS